MDTLDFPEKPTVLVVDDTPDNLSLMSGYDVCQVLKKLPAGMDGEVHGGTVRWVTPAIGQISTPSANTLLTSIAVACGPRAMAIVVSDAGRDGLKGCRAICAAGGLVLMQKS